MSVDHDKAEALFDAALKFKPEEREVFLANACAGDTLLRRQVEELIDAAGDAEAFLPTDPRTISAQSPLTEKTGDRIGRYKLLQQIGEGGCGVVYMAEQEEPVRRRVALKVIKLGMDTKSVIARFEAERQALALMDHPNIAKVLDAGATETGRPYFVMELVRGIRITDYCDQNNLATRGRLDLFIQICHAIQHAHQKGIIHRDIKPSNVLVSLHDGWPVPVVIDFGIAKATEQRLTNKTLFTAFEQFIGTPAYTSPEQAEMSRLDIDTRSDIYGLGVLLYELLTGKTPFDSKELLAGLEEMRRTIREQEPARPSTRLSTLQGEELTTTAKRRGTEAPKLIHLVRGDLDWIVMKCLEKDRARRYETANGLALDIERHLHSEPVVARPPSTAYRVQKFVRRNRVMVGAAGLVALALVVGLGAATVMFFRERVARRGEQQQRVAAQSAQKVSETQRQLAETERQRADAHAREASESQRQSRRMLYATDMSFAQQALKLNDLGRARRLLDRHRPLPGQDDLRGWEWRYLWQLTRHSAMVTLTDRPTRGMSVSLSPDASRLVVGWLDGRVDLWDVPSRRWIRALAAPLQPLPAQVAFSPVRNLVVATSESKVVRLFDLDSGRESVLWRAPEGPWNVWDLSFSQDGSRVVIYAGSSPELGGAAWVLDVSSSQTESRHSTGFSNSLDPTSSLGAARLAPDNRRLYMSGFDALNHRFTIRCIDLATGEEIWQTEPLADSGLSTLTVSPDGRVLASGWAFLDSTIRIWEAATGRLLAQLPGHSRCLFELAFTQDGRRLISAASDQTIRVWDTSTWTETKVLRGHTDEVHCVAVSEAAQIAASAGKDGNLILWKMDGTGPSDGSSRLPESLGVEQVIPLDQSRVLLLPPGQLPHLVDFKSNSAPVTLSQMGTSASALYCVGCVGTNLLCLWNGTNQIIVGEVHGTEFIQRGAITLDSGRRPVWVDYNAARQLLAWAEGASWKSVYVASLAATGRRIELRSDVPGLEFIWFSEDGNCLAAHAWDGNSVSVRAWNIETGQIVASMNGGMKGAKFAADGRVLVVAYNKGTDHEVAFYDLPHPDREPRRVPGKHAATGLAVSPAGGLLAASSEGGIVRLFDPARGEWVDDLHSHQNAVAGIAFSADGRRLISTHGGRDAVTLWDVGTRQELLTLGGVGEFLSLATWSADNDVILAGTPWQAWRAPSWEEIAAAEANGNGKDGQP